MHEESVRVLACPVCGGGLVAAGATLRCSSGHVFDVARQGYVNLLAASAPSPGDSADMVAARQRFLERGHFRPLAEALSAEVAAACTPAGGAAAEAPPRCTIAEVGAGTGYYLAAAMSAVLGSAGVALDLSKYACRRAARAHPDIVAAVADAWGRLPLRERSVDVLLDVFAPRNAAEFARVLRPEGALVVATPNAAHLAELVAALGLLDVDPDKDRRVADALEPAFVRSRKRRVRAALALSREDATDVARMGPSAHHIGAGELDARAQALPEVVETALDVTLTTWRLRS